MISDPGDRLPDPPTAPDDAADERGAPDRAVSFPIVGVGASAGGLEAFTQLLHALPADTGMGFVLVQHLAPSHPSALAEILSRATQMPVMEVHDEPTVKPNHIYVIPPGQSMIIAGGALQLLPREGQGIHRPVDRFFRALAEDRGHQAIGVVLSGTATDGTAGLEAIKAEGGITFAQDATAQHGGMPQSAIASGCVDFVAAPNDIAREIVRISRHPSRAAEEEPGIPGGDAYFRQIVQRLHQATGVDFTHYKFNTLSRRITRRLVLQKLEGLPQYLQFLRSTPAEVDALYQDILISVTSFFRDPEAFEALKEQVFPLLVKDRSRHDPVRIWTLGCSTGEEAYSLAMAFTEFAEAAGSAAPLQLFATDLNAAGVDKARAGVYSPDIVEYVSPDRLRRFFTEVDGGYRISKTIRDACVFSRHNVLADPPFSRLDLISCRNMLIYLEPVLQQKVLPILHYALKPGGWLWLGSSETIGADRSLFEAKDVKHKLYSRKAGFHPGAGQFPRRAGDAAYRPPFTPVTARPGDRTADLHREADRILSGKFAPPGVLVSADLEILQYRGETGRYLTPAPGKASLNLLKMLREGLLVPVQAVVAQAGEEQTPVRKEGLRVKSNGGHLEVAVEVIPVGGRAGDKGGFLILFEDAGGAGWERRPPDPTSHPEAGTALAAPAAAADRDAERLAQELASTREYLQSVIEQQEAANEELQSANEEIQSANEELQSLNEELETSKEEIQSSNEELATVNDELNNRNTDLNRVNNDLVNLLGSIQMPIVMLGPDLRVRRFTVAAGKQLNLIPGDVGRPFGDLKLNFVPLPDLEPLLAEVLDTVQPRELEVKDPRGRWYSLRLRPYKTLEHKIDGVVVMLVDVDALKRAEEFTTSIVDTVREPLLVLDHELRVQAASRSFYQSFRVAPEETEHRPLYELSHGQWNIPALRQLLEKILTQDSQITDFVVEHEFEHIGKRTMRLNARRLIQAEDQPPLILLAIEDVTESEATANSLRESEQRFRELFDLGPVAVFSCDRDGVLQNYNRCAAEMWRREPARDDPRERYCGSFGLYHPDGRRLLHEESPMVQVLRTGVPVRNVEVLIERPDGSRIPVVMSFAPLRNEQGDISGAITSFYDITDRKRAEDSLRESEQRMRFVMDSMPQKLFTATPSGGVDYFNPQWTEFTGLPFETIRDWGWTQFIHPDDVAENVRVWKHSIDTGEPFQFEHRFRRADGEYRWHFSRALARRDAEGKLVMWVGGNTDIHDQMQTANQLRQYAADLSEADRHKNEFLAMLAHELRNPLAPMVNAMRIIQIAGGDPQTLRTASEMMERQIGQMVRLVDDLLDVNRISRGTIELRKAPMELASAVAHAVEAVRPQCEALGHDMTVVVPPVPIYLFGDPARLAQVIGNLLSNACKFTEPGGRIELTVVREGEQAILRVRDSGIGIPADQVPRIFDMFVQVDASLAGSKGGIGMGLTLVKELVELHDGTVEVHSAGTGHGSEFVVRLPVLSDVPMPEPEPEPIGKESTSLPRRRILVVDDNRDAADSLAALLKLAGHETETAYDGLDAVDRAETFRPELILLDIGLPKLGGYEVARRIREQPWGNGTVLVALTGWGHEDDRENSRTAGFRDHLVKPVKHDALMKLLAEL